MVNVCHFMGRLGKDPEIRATRDGREIANFSLAVSERWKDAQGNAQERTEWVKVSCFKEGLVKVIKAHVEKGTKLYIQGKMQTRKWQDQSGQDRYSTEIVLEQLEFCESKSSSEQRSDSRPSQREEEDDGLSDDIPF